MNLIGKTAAEWEAIRKERQAIADSKRITYGTFEQVQEHAKGCDICQIEKSPTTCCDVAHDILHTFPKYEYCEMGNLTCARCGKEWEECDWSEISNWQGEKVSCRECGMIHLVESAEYKLEVKIVETGEYDPDCLPDDTDS